MKDMDTQSFLEVIQNPLHTAGTLALHNTGSGTKAAKDAA